MRLTRFRVTLDRARPGLAICCVPVITCWIFSTTSPLGGELHRAQRVSTAHERHWPCTYCCCQRRGSTRAGYVVSAPPGGGHPARFTIWCATPVLCAKSGAADAPIRRLRRKSPRDRCAAETGIWNYADMGAHRPPRRLQFAAVRTPWRQRATAGASKKPSRGAG